MARTTLLVLPCDIEDDVMAVKEALEASQGNKVGIRKIEWDLEPLRVFDAGECRKQLWRLAVTKLEKGVQYVGRPQAPFGARHNVWKGWRDHVSPDSAASCPKGEGGEGSHPQLRNGGPFSMP